MGTFSIAKVYSEALSLPAGRFPSSKTYSQILVKALKGLGAVNQGRLLHTFAVLASLKAINRQDTGFFFDKIPEETKIADMKKFGLDRTAYQQRYSQKMGCIFIVYRQLSPFEKEILGLAILAHDLGIPFGLEWEHHLSGEKVARELIKDKRFQDPIADLIKHHGEFSNLPSSSFPRDIYRLPPRWQRALFILDFCDATGRIEDNRGKHTNPIGLGSLEYYAKRSKLQDLIELESSYALFDLRFRYGFGPIIFNRSLSADDQAAMFAQATALTPSASEDDLITFYGSRFRCHFFDVLLLASLETAAERGMVLASVYKVYADAQMSKEALLWPDQDLGLTLGQDFMGFATRFRAHFGEHGISTLLRAKPEEEQIEFLVSAL
ncbi:MAG: hypothetical protein HQ596_01135 [Candidatus Saganbacteria bacterium]|nr:hypothetical protein [Candidatus Saganbacteria bacterium]